jgi:hypothetical protein
VEQQVSLPLFLIKTETDIQATFTSHQDRSPQAHDRRAGAGASPWKSSRGTMPLTATRTAADALLSPCVPATR